MKCRNFVFVVLTLTFPASLVAEEPAPQRNRAAELVGTWRMVSMKVDGQVSDLPNQLLILKHITPTHMTWMRSERDSGQVVAMACGKWSIEDDKFSDTPEYGVGNDFSRVKGNTHIFSCKIVGNHWYHTGKLANGVHLEEVWERQQNK